MKIGLVRPLVKMDSIAFTNFSLYKFGMNLVIAGAGAVVAGVALINGVTPVFMPQGDDSTTFLKDTYRDISHAAEKNRRYKAAYRKEHGA